MGPKDFKSNYAKEKTWDSASLRKGFKQGFKELQGVKP
jgi:hypothetical protein